MVNSLKAQTQAFNTIADASVYQGSGGTSNYHDKVLLVKNRLNGGVTRSAYLKFDLSTFNLTTVGQAKVRMYMTTRDKPTEPAYINAYKVLDNSWAETTINWINKPALSSLLGITKIEQAGKYYEWDITTYAREVINSTGNKLITIAFTDELGADDNLTFAQKESGSNIAQIVIDQQSATYDAHTYYIDNINGDDANDGHSDITAWKSLTKINAALLQPGSKVLFKAGGIWNGQLKPMGFGSETAPVIIDKYGEGEKPLFNGGGMEGEGVVYVRNFPFIEINNLEIVNDAATGGDRRGVEITANNYGLVQHIYLRNLHIHHIKGLVGHDEVQKKTAGIYITTTADNTVDTRYDDIRIENCLIHHIQNQGIVTNAVSVSDYPGTPNFERRKITNFLVRDNVVHHIAKNAMIIRMTDGGLVERNLCYETAIGDGITPITGNTIFSRTVRGTVFQYNEGFLNRSPDYDGSLYDADLISPGTIWQYSYSHDNAHGLMWYCTDPRDTGVVVRYNISQNDKGRLMYFNYDFTSSAVYNNVFYVGENVSPTIISENKNNDHNYQFYNNIIYNNSTTAKYTLATSGSGIQTRDYSHNIFYGQHPTGEPTDPFKITTDPLFINPGSGATGLTTLDGYKLKPGSPALGAGKVVANNGGKDFYGNPVSSVTAPNIGVYNGEALISMVNPNFHLYLLIGQSNMAGRGVISGEYVYQSHPRVLMLNANGEWVQAKHPLHFDKPSVAGVGPGLQFAIEMANNNPDITIGLIPAAVGGTAISAWSPGATDEATGLKPYDDAVARTQIALQRGVLKGILFHQGEANSGSSNLTPWKTAVKNLADNLRTTFNTPNIPFIVGELGYFRATSANLNNILPQLVTEIPNSGMVSAQGLTDKGDGTHFDSNSASILGFRYAQKMLEIQQLIALPLNIYAFTAQKANNGILLKWKKERSDSFKSISIERAGNDKDFKSIGKQETDAKTGSFIDVAPLNGDNYYRLKQTDNDGKYFYTETVHQYYNLSGNSKLTLYPNPTDGKLYVQWLGCKGTPTVHIYNMAGKKEKSISITDCSSAIDVSFLANGIYVVKVTNGDNVLGASRFIKK